MNLGCPARERDFKKSGRPFRTYVSIARLIQKQNELLFKKYDVKKRRFLEDAPNQSVIFNDLGRVQNLCATEEHAGLAGDRASNN